MKPIYYKRLVPVYFQATLDTTPNYELGISYAHSTVDIHINGVLTLSGDTLKMFGKYKIRTLLIDYQYKGQRHKFPAMIRRARSISEIMDMVNLLAQTQNAIRPIHRLDV